MEALSQGCHKYKFLFAYQRKKPYKTKTIAMLSAIWRQVSSSQRRAKPNNLIAVLFLQLLLSSWFLFVFLHPSKHGTCPALLGTCLNDLKTLSVTGSSPFPDGCRVIIWADCSAWPEGTMSSSAGPLNLLSVPLLQADPFSASLI